MQNVGMLGANGVVSANINILAGVHMQSNLSRKKISRVAFSVMVP